MREADYYEFDVVMWPDRAKDRRISGSAVDELQSRTSPSLGPIQQR
jgi:hypothetical protein